MPLRRVLFMLLLPFALPASLDAGVVHASLGVCTRKDEFAKRQEALDEKVVALKAATKSAKRKSLTRKLVKQAEKDIECLIRYREPHLVPVLIGVVGKSKRWYTRSRALYALKMIGDRSSAKALAPALSDKHPMVREAAAITLGHWGGEQAATLLDARLAKEKDTYVTAALTASLALARAEKRPYDKPPLGTNWVEALTGPEEARRVRWEWTVKGSSRFNTYEAGAVAHPDAERFLYPFQLYKEDLFAGYPRNSFGAGGSHAGEDCAWFRDGCGIYSIAAGVVRMVQGAGGDWGFLVAIEHRLPDGHYVTSTYGHLAFDLRVRAGDVVKAGQLIATLGLSCSIENGGYGAHIHFGLGHGPFRRPIGLAVGDEVKVDPGDGTKVTATVVRLGYEEGRTEGGWPLTTYTARLPGGKERLIEVPRQPLGQEIGWFQAYVAKCRGWLNPQEMLPTWVGKD